MKKISKYLFLTCCFLLLFTSKVSAFCPICTVAAASAVGLSRWLGVDDTISGVWLGGLTVATIGWTIAWSNSRKINFAGRDYLIAIVYYALILIPFYKTDIVSFHPANMLWGLDKIVLGMIIGSLLAILGHGTYLYIKKANGGHSHFPFEKLVFDLSPLLIMTAIFYFITRK